jgi:transglutaminase-like putative cysteine protease
MRLSVEHTTTFSYDAPIVEASTELRLQPLDTGGQRCLSFRLETEPRGVRIHAFLDHAGNAVGHLDVLEPHDRLTVRATSDVITSPLVDPGPPTLLELHEYLEPTPYATLGAPLLAPAATSSGAADRAYALMEEVASRLTYEKGATSVQTAAPDVLALGRGVCQDFAHVLIAACRLDGIPARYVSGYLHDDALENGHGESHAWVDVFDGDRGWISLDPTHRREQDESYVRVAVGRDYADVPPTRGVFKGNANETLSVKVVVSTREEAGPR